tara:strand:- start:468 stop:1457 length:990 start_codon:yes stop_codon:yes gene_type:complete
LRTILVTGGAGFIGSYLVNKFINDGINVVIVDILKSEGGISFIHPNAIFLNYDLCDEKLYPQLDQFKFSAIYHLAANSSSETSYDDSLFDIKTNSYGTCLIAKYCYEKKIPRFIYTSTVAVYGSFNGKISESNKISPNSIYGISKFSGELFIQKWLKNSKTKFTIFRIFNTYGPGENLNFRKKGMVSIYASYIWKNETILVKGSLDRYRDFTYIEDTLDVLTKSIDLAKSFNKIYNLSNGKKIIIRDALAMMLKISGKKTDYKIKEIEGTPGDSFGTHASNFKLMEDFQWQPKFDLEEGLSRYFNWINILPLVDNLSGFHPFELNQSKN